jgi:aconitate hydratase
VNFGILPLTFGAPADYDRVQQGDVLELPDLRERLGDGRELELVNQTRHETYVVRHQLSPRQVEIVRAGSLISVVGSRIRS